MFKYLLTEQNGQRVLSAFIDGEMYHITGENQDFDEIRRLCEAEDLSVIDLFNPEGAIRMRFEDISDRVTVQKGQVYFDGDPVKNTLTEHILRALDEGADFEPLVRFFENIAANPVHHSREQLYNWLDTHDFTINQRGMIVGYKSVQLQDDGSFRSIHAGPGVVNGKVYQNEKLPQNIGSVVEVPRSYVNHKPSVGCSQGLHVGTYDYAKRFSGNTVLKVEVNPRDVVSVPNHDQKVRVCRYRVLQVVDGKVDRALDIQDHLEDMPEDLNWDSDATPIFDSIGK